MLRQGDALEAAVSILNGARADEQQRLDMIAAALAPGKPAVVTPKLSAETMQRLAIKARTNYLPLIVDTFSQALKVEGYRAKGAASNARAWANWQLNAMDARQTGIHRAALTYGAAYATALPGDIGPVITGYSPRQMTAVYQNPSRDEWPMLALEVDGNMLRLYDEEAVYYLGDENGPRSGLSASSTSSFGLPNLGGWRFIEARPHGLGVCPVVRYRDRMLLEGEEQYGIVQPLLAIQERVDETVFGLLVAQFFSAFRQRYVIGWVPESEAEEMKASASQMWTFADTDTKVGDLTETDLTRYLNAKSAAVRDMAAIAQIPATSLSMDGVSNISAEALAGLEAAKDRKVDEVATSLGESHEQLLRLCALVEGDKAGAADFEAQVRWKSTSTRSLAQVTDALTKWVQALDVPVEFAWSRLPDVTDTDIDLMRKLREQQDQQAQAKLPPALQQQQPGEAQPGDAAAAPDAAQKPAI